jgi:hypothetical protein
LIGIDEVVLDAKLGADVNLIRVRHAAAARLSH